MIGNIFLILTAYYLIKPVREGWLAISDIKELSKLEIKAYSAFAQTMLLIAIMPLYAGIASRLTRRSLILSVGGFFALLLVVFWLMHPENKFTTLPYLEILFYLFVGIFSVTLVAQFWAFSADLYGPERGQRLFPIVAVGAASGAVAGSWLGEYLVKSELVDAFDLILIALVPLAAALALAAWSDRRGAYGHPSERTATRWQEPAAPGNEGSYRLILRHRYLTAIALMIMLFSWVVASGDNILFGLVQERLGEDLSALAANPQTFNKALRESTTAFYGDLYFWVNLASLVLQAFFVSRILRHGGLGALLLLTPLVSLVAYVSMAIAPVLGLIKAVKVAENASNYSINNTARHLLWLPTTKQMLYQAKPTVDSLFVRLGDGLAALTILIGTRVLDLDNGDFVILNIFLVILWIALCVYLYHENRRWSAAFAQSPQIQSGV